jgi:hypothetical protein
MSRSYTLSSTNACLGPHYHFSLLHVMLSRMAYATQVKGWLNEAEEEHLRTWICKTRH